MLPNKRNTQIKKDSVYRSLKLRLQHDAERVLKMSQYTEVQ